MAQAPQWMDFPPLALTIGAPTSFDLSGYVSDPDGDPLMVVLDGELPAGFAYDQPSKTLSYDGSGTAGDYALTFAADDGYELDDALAEIVAKNAQIAALQVTIGERDATIVALQEQLADCQAVPAPAPTAGIASITLGYADGSSVALKA